MGGDANHYDLIIVGCGAAGLSAGISYMARATAERRKARVVILESAPREERGGASAWTTARLRARADFSLDPNFVGKMERISKGLSDLDYCRKLESEVPHSLRFLESHGVELLHFDPPVAMGVTHEVTPKGGGRAMVDALAKVVDATDGIEIRYRSEAIRLSQSGEGRVDGVVVRGADGLLETLHGRAVVLACGGFEGNQEMLTRYVGRDACDLKLLAPGLAYNQGAGIRMAAEIGAALSGQYDMIHAELVDRRTTLADAYIYAHPFGIVVNGKAERFYDEGKSTFEDTFELIAYEVWRDQAQEAFFIADQTIKAHPGVMVLFNSDVAPVKANSIPELAKLLGLDPQALRRTVDAYNAAIQPGEFDPNRRDGKRTEGITPPKSNWAYRLEKPPFFAYPMVSAICFTYGGMRTDTKARVVTANGTPIPGLYAAGEIVGLYYHEYPAGTSVLKAVSFGRIAGEHAAEAALANQ
jgi:tricarballylate dehydrogenase